MELYILDALFRRKILIEQFESLLWTERFNELGDFKAVLPATNANRVLFKPGLYFGLNKSDRIMKLETVEDTINDDGKESLTLTGRSLELILTYRNAWYANTALGDDPTWTVSGTPKEIIDYIIKHQFIDGFAWYGYVIPNLSMSSLYPTDTILPPSESIIVTTTKPMPVYDYIKDIAKKYSLGFRIYKGPQYDNNIYYNTYSGNDRSLGQTELPPVLFSRDLENLNSLSSLKSVEKQFIGCYVFSKYGYDDVYVEDYVESASGYTGLNRSIFSIVVTEPDELTTESERQAYRQQKGREALAEAQDIFIVDGEISERTTYIYGVDYFLGDLVDMRDDAGVINRMRVVEQIFTEDAEGEKAYPTLASESLIAPGTWAALSGTLTWPNAVGEWNDQIGEI